MALIVPERGQGKDVAKALLILADDPHHVQTTMDGPAGVSFVVPDYLHDLYVRMQQAPGPEDVEDEVPADDADAETATAPKRRGRPPGSKNRPKDAETEE